jgi:ABC-type Fe3+/spermidine/putrescine transport system ATPase subunit
LVKKVSSGFSLKDITITVPSGSTLALFGPSGCGKTTTLRLMAGFEQPDAGSICINGELVSTSKLLGGAPSPRHRHGVSGSGPVAAHDRPGTSLVCGGRPGRQQTEKEHKIAESLDRVQLSQKADAFPHQLSGGEKQRLAMARALAAAPDVLLMDEPLSSLDAHLRSSLLRQTRHLIRKMQMTTVYVTHDWHEAIYLADWIAIMKDGGVTKMITAENADTCEEHSAAMKIADLSKNKKIAAG